MIRAFPFVNSLRSTLLPGEFSTRTSRFGSLSPTLMNEREVQWKPRADRVPLNPSWRMANLDAMIKLLFSVDDGGRTLRCVDVYICQKVRAARLFLRSRRSFARILYGLFLHTSIVRERPLFPFSFKMVLSKALQYINVIYWNGYTVGRASIIKIMFSFFLILGFFKSKGM